MTACPASRSWRMRSSSAAVSRSASAVVGSSRSAPWATDRALWRSRRAGGPPRTVTRRGPGRGRRGRLGRASRGLRSSRGRVIPRRAGNRPIIRFSPTERSGSRLSSWYTTPMPAARACAGVGLPTLDRPPRTRRVAPDRPGEDLDERALPRAVLPGQAVHLTGPEVEVDVGERLDRPVRFDTPRSETKTSPLAAVGASVVAVPSLGLARRWGQQFLDLGACPCSTCPRAPLPGRGCAAESCRPSPSPPR